MPTICQLTSRSKRFFFEKGCDFNMFLKILVSNVHLCCNVAYAIDGDILNVTYLKSFRKGPRAEVGFPTAGQGFSSIQDTLFHGI